MKSRDLTTGHSLILFLLEAGGCLAALHMGLREQGQYLISLSWSRQLLGKLIPPSSKGITYGISFHALARLVTEMRSRHIHVN